MAAKGSATLDFGASPGKSTTSVVVTGETYIEAGSSAEAFLMAEPSADHNAYEHGIIPMRLSCGSVVAGVGFTITAVSDLRLTGAFTVRWVWA